MGDRNNLSSILQRDSHRDPELLLDSVVSNPPRKPAGWRPPGPKPEFTTAQRANPYFVQLATAAWSSGKGYLIDWLWTIADNARIIPAWRQELHRRRMEVERNRQMESY